MTPYYEMIEGARLISSVESTLTTGDASYDGTALEVADQSGQELFHVVVDSQGERQFLFFRSNENIRLPLRVLEEILNAAKEKVNQVPM